MEAKEEQALIHTTKSFLPPSLPKPKVGWSLDLDTDIHILVVQKESMKMGGFIPIIHIQIHIQMDINI